MLIPNFNMYSSLFLYLPVDTQPVIVTKLGIFKLQKKLFLENDEEGKRILNINEPV